MANMIRSMTAFSSQSIQADWGSLTWEIRSVNHRYLDMNFRIPESLRDLEPWCREVLRSRLQRGKIDCTLRFQTNQASGLDLSLDTDLLQKLLQITDEISAQKPDIGKVSAADLLQWPGLVKATDTEVSVINVEAKKLFHKAIDGLIETREREGVEMQHALLERTQSIEGLISALITKIPEINSALRAKLVARIGDIKETLEPSRLEQEVAILAQKADIAEEIDRIQAHLKETNRILTKGGAVGRRLDFLMQEFNREANTIASKASEIDTTQSALELKVLIEQMREQIQNIE